MSYRENKKRYNIEYTRTHLKRIPLNVQKEKYEEIRSAADASGKCVRAWIKEAIDARLRDEKSD